MKIGQFDGGLSVRIDPSLININEGIEYENIDTSKGILSPLKDLVITEEDLKPYFYKYKSTFVDFDLYTDFLEYREILYYSTEGLNPRKHTLDFDELLGIEAPPTEPAFDGLGNPILDDEGIQIQGLVITTEPFDELDFDITLTAIGNGDIPNSEVLDYKFTLVSGTFDVKEINKQITLGGSDSAVNISMEESDGIIIRVYREYLGTFRLLKELSLDADKAILDNVFDISEKTAFDSIAGIDGVVQYTLTYFNDIDGTESPPMDFSEEIEIEFGNKVIISNIPSPTDPQVTAKKLYRLGANLINMTLVAKFDIGISTHEDYVTDVNATTLLDSFSNKPPDIDLQFLVQAYGILFGAVKDNLVFTQIGQPNYWPVENFIDFDADITGIFVINGGLLICTLFKTFLLAGSTSATFIRFLLSEKQGCINHKSFQLIKNIPLWISLDGVCALINGYPQVISIDKLGPIILPVIMTEAFREQYFILLDDGTGYIFDFQTNLKIGKFETPQTIQGLGKFDNTFYCSVSGKQGELFVGNDLELTYTSPLLTDSRHSELKQYNVIYIRSDGSFDLQVFIDNVSVLVISLFGNTTHELKVPAQKQAGYAISFEIIGIVKVYEIEFKSLPRQNDR